jgi:hypothetical protein
MKTLQEIKSIEANSRKKDRQDFIAVMFCVALSCLIILSLAI